MRRSIMKIRALFTLSCQRVALAGWLSARCASIDSVVNAILYTMRIYACRAIKNQIYLRGGKK